MVESTVFCRTLAAGFVLWWEIFRNFEVICIQLHHVYQHIMISWSNLRPPHKEVEKIVWCCTPRIEYNFCVDFPHATCTANSRSRFVVLENAWKQTLQADQCRRSMMIYAVFVPFLSAPRGPGDVYFHGLHGSSGRHQRVQCGHSTPGKKTPANGWRNMKRFHMVQDFRGESHSKLSKAVLLLGFKSVQDVLLLGTSELVIPSRHEASGKESLRIMRRALEWYQKRGWLRATWHGGMSSKPPKLRHI